MVVTICSWAKNRGGVAQAEHVQRVPWIVDIRRHAQPEVERLVPAAVLERLFLPAYVRYSGEIYQAVSPILKNLDESRSDLEFLILSGYYGVMDYREPIWNYELDLKKTPQAIEIWRKHGLGVALKKHLDEKLDGYQRLFVLTSDYRNMVAEALVDGFRIKPVNMSGSTPQEWLRFYGEALAHAISSRLVGQSLSDVPVQKTKSGVHFEVVPVA